MDTKHANETPGEHSAAGPTVENQSGAAGSGRGTERNPIELGHIGPGAREQIDTVFGFLGSLVRWHDLTQGVSGAEGRPGNVSGIVIVGADPGNGGGTECPPTRALTDLADAESLEQFLDEALAYHEVRALFREDWRTADLVAFNVRHRYRVIGHDPKKHTLIGRLVAKAKNHPREFLEQQITELFLSAIAKPMTRRKHAHVMTHVVELLGSKLDASEQSELADLIGSYAKGDIDRGEPLARLRDQVQATRIAGLVAQSYLFPDEILLRVTFRSEWSAEGSD
ncbi:MAG: YbgA family protein [Candidatus Eisenbacteria bacterium]